MTCPRCHALGWVLDGDASKSPLALELLACPLPDCEAHGRDIAILSLNEGRFSRVARQPRGRFVMSVARSSGRVVVESNPPFTSAAFFPPVDAP